MHIFSSDQSSHSVNVLLCPQPLFEILVIYANIHFFLFGIQIDSAIAAIAVIAVIAAISAIEAIAARKSKS